MLRSPTVSATHIAFAHASDIWIVERAGGAARRLTAFQGQCTDPRLSPDGRWVAFSGEYAGNADVYVVAAAGGAPRRLTWHPGPDLVRGWTPDGAAILFASGRATAAPTPATRFWTVPLEGGPATALPLPRAYQGRLSPDGRRVAYRLNGSWDEERRNYRGGQNKPVWVTDLGTLETVTAPWEGSKETEPVWLGERVCFLSDRDGVANVWAWDPRGREVVPLTRFRDFDVKTLDAGAGVLVFEQAGVVHELDPASGKSRVVEITAAGDLPWMMPHWEDVSARVTRMELSPTGKRVLLEARGEIFTVPGDKGDTRNLTRTSGSAEHEPAWSPDGKRIAYFSDRSGEYQILIEDQDGIAPPRVIDLPEPKRHYTLSWSPDSKKLAYHDTDLRVWVLDVASGRAKTLGRDPWMVPFRTLRPMWSPDSRWLAWSAHLNSLHRAIVVADVESGAVHQVTDGMADALSPAWDPDGKHLWFLASTNYALGSAWLDMTAYEREERFGLYCAILRQGDPSPFLPESDEDTGVAAESRGAGGAESKDAPAAAGRRAAAGKDAAAKGEAPARGPVEVRIDLDGLASRIVAAPGVSERRYSSLEPGVGGTLFYLETPAGAPRAAGAGPGPGATLHRYKVSERKAVTFATEVADFAVSADGKKLVYRTVPPGGGGPPGPGGPPQRPTPPNLFLVDADKPPPAAGQGRLAVSLRMWLDPAAEFAQMFHEGWRNQRDYLYVKSMHGADWPRLRETYGRFLPHVMHRADLTYLLDMMGAELAVGHSYVRGGDMPEVPASTGGLLGADLAVEDGRYRITRIYDGESWNPELRAPLGVPGLAVAVGDYVLAIDGEPLRGDDDIHRLLDGTANRQTVLTVNGRPTLDGARRVTVVPVASETGLRARAWVEANRRLVDRLSGGRLAYVHVPNTGQQGFESFNRYYFAQQDREGAVIDERYNGGGSAADYMIEVLRRRIDGYFNNVVGDRVPFTVPAAGIWGAKVMVINEMAGSGGDLFPYLFRAHGIGPIVGTRTWGGLVHTADSPTLVDGGTMIAPRGGFFTVDGRWAVENEGVAPDIEVENWPKEVAAGGDPQLERAVEEAMEALRAKPVERLMREPAPPTWGERRR
jgi:tricorn protease